LGITELATLADLGLGGAIRHQLRDGAPLPTVTLTVQLDRACRESDVVVTACGQGEADGGAGAVGQLRTSAGPLGWCLGAFAVHPWTGGPRLPWEGDERDEPAPLTEAEMTAEEAEVAAALHGEGGGLGQRLLRPVWQHEEGLVRGTVTPGLAVLNRSGTVQGGALVGLIVAGAEAAVSQQRRLLGVHVQFVRPARMDPLRVEAGVIHAGRSRDFATVLASQDEETVATATVTLVREDDFRA
jgi:acyl-coenzyme A thioesterase PaaI-like protein